jgi:hypothetical protein
MPKKILPVYHCGYAQYVVNRNVPNTVLIQPFCRHCTNGQANASGGWSMRCDLTGADVPFYLKGRSFAWIEIPDSCKLEDA